MNDFQNGSSTHVSAAMQLTLREEYAVALHLARISREQNRPLGVPLQRPSWVLNSQADNPFAFEEVGIKVK
jgi:hypothetical protein